ncbi:FAD-dependent oxidoreductase [Sporomusa acidovorans]|uniref:Coenzyme A disulfide reductase n=1 Tax=Sporomusa acidovorans (strain ATCC 49682 / DSM 3132 / Mol) TaxID=1123286 RepID=A0ABZ3J0G1_SPOA4|nr:FAD-dependent oxidoreductase [Sporomusa acidovorans]OZC17324.1 NADH peroxidase [Sporomusa acidovorans DSM 3132]SDF84950.1 NADPH-dependent 2,4-dienoyl-CoA reductase, sulfur reductase [Sporomusa acidovorans]
MQNIVIIGAVAAGLKAASKARRCDPEARITVIEKGDLISYGACGMPYYIAGDVQNIEDLMKTPVGILRNPNYFKNIKDITVLTQTLATAIDRQAKTVNIKNLTSGTEEIIPYDKLVIATGASAIKPQLPGVDLANIYQLWHPSDAKAIREGLEEKRFKNAVIIGSGLVGMEMADALSKWDISVTVLIRKNQVFRKFLDPEMAGIVSKYVQNSKISLLMSENVVRFTGNTAVEAIETDKRILPADLVILAIGARPNIELAKAAGLVIGPTGAIAVDEEMRTSDPAIYAGGDCVENVNLISGQKVFAPMGSTANKHGRIIGENLCGGHVKFNGILNTVVVKIHNLTVGKTGLTEQDAKQLGYEYITAMVAGHDKPHYMPGAKPITVKLIAHATSGKILGLQAVGEGEVAKRVDIAATALTLGGTIDDLFNIDLSYSPPYNSPIDNVAVAANAVMNKLAGKLKGISSLQAKEKLPSEQTVFLDVRTPDECKQIRLAGCKNIQYIPLGQLRSRLSELNKKDEIVAFCKISLRGYEAEGILEGAGFENVKVMEGGILSWPFACEKE